MLEDIFILVQGFYLKLQLSCRWLLSLSYCHVFVVVQHLLLAYGGLFKFSKQQNWGYF